MPCPTRRGQEEAGPRTTTTIRKRKSTATPRTAKVRPSSLWCRGGNWLALAVSLFVPKSSMLLWFLRVHLQRNADNRTECGKYAAYCERALERTIVAAFANGSAEHTAEESSTPFTTSFDASSPVERYIHITSFDGSTTIKEFQDSLAQEIGCRTSNGFAMFSDDPIEKDLEHTLEPSAKLCDLISKWEIALREKGLGKFENSKVIRLTYKNRIWWKNCAKLETEKERLLLCYQARLRQQDSPMIWLAVGEDAITVLDLATMQQRVRYPYTNVLTFGGCQEDFMLVVTQNDQQPSQKLIFSLSKPKILELTLLIADYMNLLMNPGTPLLGTLSRGTMVSVNQSAVNQSIISQTIANQSQPDILKSTPDHAMVQRSDSKRRTHIDSGLA
nr:unnamed protein product [Callosobruchus chinensis]